MDKQWLHFFTMVQRIRGVEMLDVNKEVQRNDWFTDFLDKELKVFNIQSTKESLYGRSRPDFAFFKQNDTWIRVGVIIQPDMYVNMLGSTVEFKMDIGEPKRLFPQAFANMVRVANNLVINSLTSGKIVNSVTIYGLLVSYDKESAIPIKYLSRFSDNTYEITVGQKDTFSKLFSWVVFIGVLDKSD